jgi:hypothetical protein
MLFNFCCVYFISHQINVGLVLSRDTQQMGFGLVIGFTGRYNINP